MPGPTIISSINAGNCMSTDATFRAWGSAISAALATAGWVQTTDTGQINWTTVIRPVGVNTAAGYEIWKLADTLQATAPIFLKIEYGNGPATTLPGVWTTVGTASDGAGTLTSIAGSGTSVTTRTAVHPSNSADSWQGGVLPIHVNGDGSSLVLAMFPNTAPTNAASGMFFAVERFRNWDGTPNGDGFLAIWASNGVNSAGTGKSQCVYFTTTVAQPGQLTGLPGVVVQPGGSASCVVGSTLYPLPVLPMWGGKTQAPAAMVLEVLRNDVAAGNNFAVTHYGVAHTFYGLGAGLSTGGYGTLAQGAIGYSFLYRMD